MLLDERKRVTSIPHIHSTSSCILTSYFLVATDNSHPLTSRFLDREIGSNCTGCLVAMSLFFLLRSNSVCPRRLRPLGRSPKDFRPWKASKLVQQQIEDVASSVRVAVPRRLFAALGEAAITMDVTLVRQLMLGTDCAKLPYPEIKEFFSDNPAMLIDPNNRVSVVFL